jgi:hypothetical protein
VVTGMVTENRDPVVEIVLVLGEDVLSLPAVIDTGFNGYLSDPPLDLRNARSQPSLRDARPLPGLRDASSLPGLRDARPSLNVLPLPSERATPAL